MRKKDDLKQEAIIKAVITQTNEIGFVNISMSKIAKAAGISPSTLYIYYANKETMFEEIYKDCKREMLEVVNSGLLVDIPVKTSVMQFCQNVVNFLENYLDTALFLEQATNSPVLRPHLDEKEQLQLSKPAYAVFNKGIKEGILKDTDPNLLIGFCMYPIVAFYKEVLQNEQLEEIIDYNYLFSMCWDAIKA